MIAKLRLFLWKLGIIKIKPEEIGLPSGEDLMDIVREINNNIEVVRIDASNIAMQEANKSSITERA